MSNSSVSPLSYSNYINPQMMVNKQDSSSVVKNNSEQSDSFEFSDKIEKKNKKNNKIKTAIGVAVVFGSAILSLAMLKKNNKNLMESFNALFKDSDMKGVSFSKKLKTLFAGDEAIEKLSKARKASTSKLDEILDGVVDTKKKPNEEIPLSGDEQPVMTKHAGEETMAVAEPLQETKGAMTFEGNGKERIPSGEFACDEDFSEFVKKLAGKRYSSNQDVQKILDVSTRDFDKARKSGDVSDFLTYYEKLASRHERFIRKPDKKETADFISEVMSAFEKYLGNKHGISVRKASNGDIFDPSIMRKIDTAKTTDKALEGMVESMYHPGFLASNGDELRPLRVNVYEYSQE